MGRGKVVLARAHTGEHPQPRNQLLVKAGDLLRARIGDVWQGDPRGEQSLRLHSRLNSSEARETLQKQSCADEKNKRECDFNYDERVTDTRAADRRRSNRARSL